MNSTRTLITGAGGFIGSHLVETLVRQGREVRALVIYDARNSRGWLDDIPSEITSNVEIISGDIRDQFAIRKIVAGCENVIHLAALVGIPHSFTSPEAYVETNIKGTLNLLQAARDTGVRRFINTSTSEVYGTGMQLPMTEEHPLAGQSPYSATKIAADHLALSFHHAFDLPVTVVRPFNTYGPRQSNRAVIPTIISQVASGARKVRLGATSPTRDFSYVQDTVDAFISVLDSSAGIGDVVHFGSGYEVSVGDLALVIAQIMDTEIEIIRDEERVRPNNSEVMRLWADASKAHRVFGWDPKYGGADGLRKGLELTIRWFREPANLTKYKSDRYVT